MKILLLLLILIFPFSVMAVDEVPSTIDEWGNIAPIQEIPKDDVIGIIYKDGFYKVYKKGDELQYEADRPKVVIGTPQPTTEEKLKTLEDEVKKIKTKIGLL